MVAAFKGLQVDTPLGRISYRAQDNQSTMGAYVGVTTVNQGRGVMKNFRYIDGSAGDAARCGGGQASARAIDCLGRPAHRH